MIIIIVITVAICNSGKSTKKSRMNVLYCTRIDRCSTVCIAHKPSCIFRVARYTLLRVRAEIASPRGALDSAAHAGCVTFNRATTRKWPPCTRKANRAWRASNARVLTFSLCISSWHHTTCGTQLGPAKALQSVSSRHCRYTRSNGQGLSPVAS